MPMYLTFEAKTSLVENVRSQPETVKFMGILLTAGKLKKKYFYGERARELQGTVKLSNNTSLPFSIK